MCIPISSTLVWRFNTSGYVRAPYSTPYSTHSLSLSPTSLSPPHSLVERHAAAERKFASRRIATTREAAKRRTEEGAFYSTNVYDEVVDDDAHIDPRTHRSYVHTPLRSLSPSCRTASLPRASPQEVNRREARQRGVCVCVERRRMKHALTDATPLTHTYCCSLSPSLVFFPPSPPPNLQGKKPSGGPPKGGPPSTGGSPPPGKPPSKKVSCVIASKHCRHTHARAHDKSHPEAHRVLAISPPSFSPPSPPRNLQGKTGSPPSGSPPSGSPPGGAPKKVRVRME